jgi:hypothetical protein
MKRVLLYAACCLFLVFNSCENDDILTEANREAAPTERNCGTEEFMAKQMQDPEFKRAYMERMAQIESMSQDDRLALCASPTILPVAIHYQGITSPNAACLIAMAQTQINILNADYQGTNSDISTWINTASGTFPGVNYGETCVKFCIADKNHPAGFGLEDGDLAVTINQTSGDRANEWAGYINIFVRNIGGGTLGYSSLPGTGNGDGMVINRTAFSAGPACGVVNPTAPFHLGRTLTHEMGHYLNLRHIWGDGGCGASDFVDDTPDASGSNGGCPVIGKVSCGTPDMHMNYMDYTNDACMYMFTAGQSARMQNLINASLGNVVANGFNVCSAAPEPTCTDGIKNGGETGIDCGGPCGPCGQTCTNGIKDGDETGVDCGGSCPTTCGGGNPNPCPITGRYATYAAANANEVRAIAELITNSNDPEVKALVRRAIQHQDELMDVLAAMNNNTRAKSLMQSLIADYQNADKNNLRVTSATSVKLVEYLTIAKTYSKSNSAITSIIDDAINLSK